MIIDFILFVILGGFSGLIAGMLGIGGGAMVVPGLAFVFTLMGMENHIIMQMASGTSLMIMVFTALSSGLAHIKQHHLHLDAFKKLLPGVLVGTISGAIIARHLHSDVLTLIFALFLLVLGLKLLYGVMVHRVKKVWKVSRDVKMPGWLRLVGLVIGLKSGLLGIGGGTLSVPLLLYCKAPMTKASGTSAVLTLPIGLMGALSFMYLGWGQQVVGWSMGYIYLPAVLCVAPLSIIFAQIGARLSDRLPERKLKLFFAVLLLVLSAKMLILFFR